MVGSTVLHQKPTTRRTPDRQYDAPPETKMITTHLRRRQDHAVPYPPIINIYSILCQPWLQTLTQPPSTLLLHLTGMGKIMMNPPLCNDPDNALSDEDSDDDDTPKAPVCRIRSNSNIISNKKCKKMKGSATATIPDPSIGEPPSTSTSSSTVAPHC